MTRRFAAGAGLILALLLAACGSGEGGTGGPVVRDSAGVEIVESNHAAWDDGQPWELSAAPLLEIGVAEGDSLYQFFIVSGVHRLTDGRIVVANYGSRELRFYDSAGRFLTAVGREGEGPGEFRSLSRIDFLGDTLFVSDDGTYRVSVFTAEGAFVRAVHLSAFGLGITRILGLFGDGSMLLRAQGADLDILAGVNRESMLYYRINPSGTSVDTIGRFFAAEHFVEFRGNGRYSSNALPFGRRSAVAVGDRTFYYTDGASISVTEYSPQGDPIRILRYATDPMPVTEDDLDRFLEWYLSLFDETVRRRVASGLRKLPLPATMPAVSGLLVDSEGDIWVGKYRSAFEKARCWWIFAAEGQLLGSMCLPEGFTPHQIGADFVLGVRKDDLGVERVALYGLTRDASSTSQAARDLQAEIRGDPGAG